MKLLNGVITKFENNNLTVEIDGKEYMACEYVIYLLPKVGDEVVGVMHNGEFIIYSVTKYEQRGMGCSLGWSMGKDEMIDYLCAYGYDVSDFEKVIEMAETLFAFGFYYDREEEEFSRDCM